MRAFLSFLIILTIVNGLEVQMNMGSQARPSEITQINGRTVLNNQEMLTSCECVQASPEISLAEEHCDPTKLKINQDSLGKGGASFEEIRHMVGPIDELVFVDPTSYHFSCLDGRIKNPVLGTPGGDSGEFLLALNIYEQMTRPLTQEVVDSIFTSYLTLMTQFKFYMCTDDAAIDHIEKELGITTSIEILKNPIEQMKLDLMRVLVKPENTGCFHLKSILKFPDNYNIRPELVQLFLKSFYKVLWDKYNPVSEKLVLDSLIGQQEEKAFLEVRSNEACQRKLLAPLISPRKRISVNPVINSVTEFQYAESGNDWISIFVNHIDAISVKRREIAKFFSKSIHHSGEHIDIDQMWHRLNKHGLTYLELTGQRVAKYLPFYTLHLI